MSRMVNLMQTVVVRIYTYLKQVEDEFVNSEDSEDEDWLERKVRQISKKANKYVYLISACTSYNIGQNIAKGVLHHK